MTLDKLEQYIDVCNEVKLWRKELNDKWRKAGKIVKDTVSGSSPEYPYTAHPVTITGVSVAHKKLDAEEERYYKRVERCETLKKEIEDYIDGLTDSQLRQIVTYRFVKGYSWVKTAQLVGGKNSVDAVKKRVYRHFEAASA